jgi:hypothetical protein
MPTKVMETSIIIIAIVVGVVWGDAAVAMATPAINILNEVIGLYGSIGKRKFRATRGGIEMALHN